MTYFLRIGDVTLHEAPREKRNAYLEDLEEFKVCVLNLLICFDFLKLKEIQILKLEL